MEIETKFPSNNAIATPIADWFEFILDINLLERHLNNNLEPSGCGLIVQFLYQANMTEQIYSTPAVIVVPKESGQTASTVAPVVPNQHAGAEVKLKRIRMLRNLAVKTAALLNWDLIKFEKDIPIAVISDLFHIFLRFTLNESESATINNKCDVSKLENHTLFAMQLLSRWCLRTVIFAKFPKRSQIKSTQVYVSGVVNSMPNLKEANESVLKALITTVKESVEFLENCLNNLDRDICIPMKECFDFQTDSELSTGTKTNNDIDWSKSNLYELKYLKCLISYDLGMYYFQMEHYTKSLKLFKESRKFYDEIEADANDDEDRAKEIRVYVKDLGSYLIALECMQQSVPDDEFKLVDGDEEAKTMNTSSVLSHVETNFNQADHLAKRTVKSFLVIENEMKCLKSSSSGSVNELTAKLNQAGHLKEMAADLNEEDTRLYLSHAYRLSIEQEMSSLIVKNSTKVTKTSSTDDTASTASTAASTTSANSEQTLSQLAVKRNFNLVFYLNRLRLLIDENYFLSKEELKALVKLINYFENKISIRYLNDRNSINFLKHLKLRRGDFIDKLADDKMSLWRQNVLKMEKKPSSGDSNSENFRRILLHTCDLNELKKFISNENMDATQNNLRSKWSKWSNDLLRLLQLSNEQTVNDMIKSLNNLTFLKTFFQLDNANDIDFYYICLAKLAELMEIKKYSCANKIIRRFEAYLSKSSSQILIKRLIWNQKLYINLHRTRGMINSKMEDLIDNSKQFAVQAKTDPETSKQILTDALAFLLLVGENQFIINLSSNESKKSSSQICNLAYYDFFRFASKVCIELDKSDKSSLRKASRDLWDKVVEIFTSHASSSSSRDAMDHSSSSDLPYDAASSIFFNAKGNKGGNFAQKSANNSNKKDQSQAVLSRQAFKKIINAILNKSNRDILNWNRSRRSLSSANSDQQRPRILNVLISLLCTFYNITESSANLEVHSDYRYLWPSSLANANSVDLNGLTDLMKSILSESLSCVNIYSASWLRTQADVFMAQGQYSDSLKCYLSFLLCSTKYFSLNSESTSGRQALMDTFHSSSHGHAASSNESVYNDKFIKNLIRSATYLNKHTHVALLSQLLATTGPNGTHPNPSFNYGNAFKCLQEKTYMTLDDFDFFYDTIWDLTLLEFITNLNYNNNFFKRQALCLKLIASSNLNKAETSQKIIVSKRAQLFLKLINYYYF